MRCAVYVRVSTEMETQKTSIAHQISYFEKYIGERNWILYKVYQDRESGVQTKNRGGLQQLLEDSRKEKFDVILTKSVSRFARNTLEGLTIIRELKGRNIRFITIEDGFDSQEYDEFMLTLLLSMAQKESIKISERIRFGKLCRARNGYFNGSTVPYGYIRNHEKGLLPAGDLSTLVVQKIFKMYLEGKGLYKIAKELNEKSYPTPGQAAGRSNGSKIWHQSTIRKILGNPVYVGDMIQNKTKTVDVLTGKRQKNQESDLICISRTHEGIIDLQTFEEVQKRLTLKQREQIGNQKYLFSNLLICGECGSKMHFKKDKEAYLCGKVNKMGKKMCEGAYIRQEMLKVVVIKELKKIITEKISEEGLLEEIKKEIYKKTDEKRVKKIEQLIGKAVGKKERLLELLLRNVIDEGSYQRKVKEIQIEINTFEDRKKELLKELKDGEKQIILQVNQILEMKDLDFMTIQKLIHHIKIFKEKKIEISYAFRV
ncbi:recombinase family protein [Geosporobacter ferrireducens]|uniref:Serine recombinase n=1 Tax=Geosporobacter ferrireducens TaxID=1424294 RepID=A0A1D8GH20_9FIRM|nr:recombinase family protein [Geosporobacter ferrireducens]AOT70204.1 hypothetical protein Gferi_11725 [Geosporobacter ferrireducens]MTI53248.1 recombinase family protein [Geosporobacter ferrireducens]